jgi:hypothetical protein
MVKASEKMLLADVARGELMQALARESTATLWREAWALQSKIVPEAGAIQYRFIFVRTVGLPADEVTAKHRKAEAALARLRKGEDFVKVMREVTEAQKIDDKPLTVQPDNRSFDRTLLKKLQELPAGAVSDVIPGKTGLAIFQVVQKDTPAPSTATFEEMLANPTLRRQLERDMGRFPPRMKIVTQRLEKEYGAVAIPAAKDVQASLAKPGAEVLRCKSQVLTAGELKALLDQRQEPITDERIEAELKNQAQNLMLAQYAVEHVDTKKAFADPRWEIYLRRTMQRMQGRQREAQVPTPSDKDLETWVSQNQNKLSTRTLILSAVQISVTPTTETAPLLVSEEAERLRNRLKAGETAAELVKQYKNPAYKLELKTWEDKTQEEIQRTGGALPMEIEESTKLPEPVRLPHGYAVAQITHYRHGRPTVAQAHDSLALMWQADWTQQQLGTTRARIEQSIEYTAAFKKLVRQ